MSSDAAPATLTAGFGSLEAPRIAGAIPAVARVALNNTAAVELDLRDSATIKAKFAPFERVTLLWASATLHVQAGDAATVACGWIPNTLTPADSLIQQAFDGCEVSTSSTAGVTAVVPLTEAAFGRELKALVTGNAAPSFAATKTKAVGFIKVKILFSGSGVAIA